MYVPLPEDMLVVVRPPPVWTELGVVPPDTLWTLRKAVYGLRMAPRAWGLFRDEKLRAATWNVGEDTFKLDQCISDSQVWRLIKEGEETTTLGSLCTYVDDFLLMAKAGDMVNGFIKYLKSIWNMSTEVQLTKTQPMTFVGLEMQLEDDDTLLVHQHTFVKALLQKHGMDIKVKPMSTIVMPPIGEKDRVPTAEELRVLQAYAGEFTWLSTRTRADLAYWTSVIASTCTRYAEWTLNLCRKVLRYIVGNSPAGNQTHYYRR